MAPTMAALLLTLSVLLCSLQIAPALIVPALPFPLYSDIAGL